MTAHPACHFGNGVRPVAVLPGSFNPLHHGHRLLADVAGRRLGAAVHFELSAANVDKPDTKNDEIERRVAQFAGVGPVWVTRAPRFVDKAVIFPGVTFVVGWDTAVRLIHPRYYSDDTDQRDEALRTIRAAGCRVLVGGRVDQGGAFRVWDGSGLPAELQGLFDFIPEAEFRADISSTELRRGRLA
ncbi:MAG: hypothetical protein U0871_13550 [Gemmataceae bacterium]